MSMQFVKGHGTENDFVVLPDLDGSISLDPELVARLCDRRSGLGADGILRVVRCEVEAPGLCDSAEWFMDYRNADGTTAEMCGNGIRVYARYLVDAGLVAPGRVRLATRDGLRWVDVPARGDVTVDMGVPLVRPVEGGRVLVGMGNPHEVVLVDRLSALPDLAGHPDRNVEYVEEVSRGRLRMRVVERGVGETRSCGSGACAAVAAVESLRGELADVTEVLVPGGRLLVRRDGDRLSLSGPAVLVAEGVLRSDWLDA